MNPPTMLYEIARQRQAEDRARAEAWRRAHPEPVARSADSVPRRARPKVRSRRRLFHFPATLLHHAPH
jgi:hypothetical protein